METSIKIEKIWGKVRQDRYGVVVTINNKEQVFKWLPTYEELARIYCLLVEAEAINKNIELKKGEQWTKI